MDAKKTIRKLLLTITGLAAGMGLLILLISAIGEKKKGQCTGYKITVKSLNDNSFVDDKDVFRIVSAATGGSIKGQSISAINLGRLEDILRKNVWINNAQVYFDNRNVLHVSVTEREPLARIFTTAGGSFYIDSTIKRMPLSEKTSARVPVFTGFPDKKVPNRDDSLLLGDVKAVAGFIKADPFWSAQVSEVDITPEKNFEIIPVVGNNILRIGDAENLEKKFHRLFLFYNQVLGKTGFDRYKVIDAQYEGQIIAGRDAGKTNHTDTAKLKLNVQKLIKQSLEVQNDTIVTAKNIVQSTALLNPAERGVMNEEDNTAKAISPNPVKLSEKKTMDKQQQAGKREPKAVMKKRN